MRRAIPWLGLLLLAISFAWFVRPPGPTAPVARSASPPPRGERSLLVVLDPGHGGDDSGAICGTVLEKDLALDVALQAELLLRAAGFATALTRTSDRHVSLAERASLGNREENSLFISIHFNDGARAAASGIETYYAARSAGRPGWFSWLPFLQRTETDSVAAKSESLAGFIQEALVERTQAVNRGVKAEQFYVIANVRHPAALVEGGFLTNKSEVAKLATAEYRAQIARAISDGVVRYRQARRPAGTTLALAESRPE
ncbi:MAG TPA: N-acetylmuramoyl-L-alanine amidase [Chthoniobacterales bacterium]|jgi:N-acetylmuramoyl-L-alanine amidase|nr:N-acetylmuramoyl-L-alanine amidase [Chthoniobacterales bacterium]